MAIDWKILSSVEQLAVLEEDSHTFPVIIFKHSTRCAISSMAKTRFEGNEGNTTVAYYYLDLLRFREVSNAIAEKFKVHHESPQVILLANGEVVFDESHMAISFAEIEEQIALHPIGN